MSASIREYIDELAANNGDDIFLINPDTGQKISFKHLADSTYKIAQYLTKMGHKKGASIAFAGANHIDLIQAILGLLYGGFRATSINLVAGHSVIDYVLAHSDCALILCDDEHAPLMIDIVKGMKKNIDILKISDMMRDIENISFSTFSPSTLPPIHADDDGLLIYTSGTTGTPKGVLLSHKNLIAGGKNTIMAHQLEKKDRGLCSLPLYHINAFCVSMMASLLSGQSLLVPRKFSPRQFWPLIHQYKCTWFSLVPTQIAYILHHPSYQDFDKNLSSSIRFGRSASSSLAPSLQQEFECKFAVNIIETMGLSETAAQITANPLPFSRRKIGSPGIAFGNHIKIIDHKGDDAPPNVEGEILIKGDNVMKGYYKNEAASNQAFSNDGWFRSGDLGKIDEQGYLFVTGRLKELIIKGGENIAPREIDEVLYMDSRVIEAASFASPCDNYGERVEACIVVDPAHKVEKDKIIDDLMALCQKNIGQFKSPTKIHILNELPKGPSGKIQRLKLHAILYPE